MRLCLGRTGNCASKRGHMDGGIAAEVALNPNGGLLALATLLAVHKIAVDPSQLRHELGHDDPVTAQDILRLAKRRMEYAHVLPNRNLPSLRGCRFRFLPMVPKAGFSLGAQARPRRWYSALATASRN